MQNKNDNKKQKSFVKENGFLIALYSLVGVLVVVAISLTILLPGADGTKGIAGNNQLSASNSGAPDVKTVDNSLDKSYKDQTGATVPSNKAIASGKTSSITNDVINKEATTKKDSITAPKSSENAKPTTSANDSSKSNKAPEVSPPAASTPVTIKDGSSATDLSGNNSAPTPSASIKPEANSNGASKSSDLTGIGVRVDSSNGSIKTDANKFEDTANNPQLAVSVDSSTSAFKDGDKMVWPVLGQVVMNYSTDKMVYDKTLDQYRTNDTIDIAAKEGSEVVASADGKVTKVSQSIENGNYVVVDNGNGWSTTYSQLENVKVKANDSLTKGAVIGYVAPPSKFSIMLGSHLDFKVAKNDLPISPLTILEAKK